MELRRHDPGAGGRGEGGAGGGELRSVLLLHALHSPRAVTRPEVADRPEQSARARHDGGAVA